MEQIIIIGAGAQGREVVWLIREINQVSPTFEIVGFVDDNPAVQGQEICGVKVLGTTDFLADWNGKAAVLAIGVPAVKEKILTKLADFGLKWPALISPSARMSEFVEIGEGSIITAGSILTTQVVIGPHVLVNLSCTIAHDVTIGRGASLYLGVNVSGNVTIEDWAEIGTGASIIPQKTIGAHSTIGAGAVIIRDVPPGATVVGNPGRVIKVAETPTEGEGV